MTQGRWMGLDLGLRWWGVSLSDIDRKTARPLAVLPASDRPACVRRIQAWVRDYSVSRIIIGLPLYEGRWTRTTETVFVQAGYLRRRLRGLAIGFVDESETSQDARLYTAAGERDDAWAAALILQRALDDPAAVWSWDDVRSLRRRSSGGDPSSASGTRDPDTQLLDS